MSQKGTTVYLNLTDIEALHFAQDHLSTALERSDGEVPELRAALKGVYAILDKVQEANRGARRRNLVAAALAAVEETA